MVAILGHTRCLHSSLLGLRYGNRIDLPTEHRVGRFDGSRDSSDYDLEYRSRRHRHWCNGTNWFSWTCGWLFRFWLGRWTTSFGAAKRRRAARHVFKLTHCVPDSLVDAGAPVRYNRIDERKSSIDWLGVSSAAPVDRMAAHPGRRRSSASGAQRARARETAPRPR